MLELFFLILAGAVQSAASVGDGGGANPPLSQTTLTAIPQIAIPQDETDGAETVPPAFLAPQTDAAEVAPPAFLAPETESTEVAPPAFLAPQEQEIVAPAFLTPQVPALVAEPQVATGRFLTALEVKPILTATRGNWVSVREFNGQDLVYVTHIWSWRCGLLEMKLGVNGQPPEVWPLPDCHEDQAQAAAILPTDGLPYRGFPPGSVQQIEVQVTYDDLSTDQVRLTRLGTIIP